MVILASTGFSKGNPTDIISPYDPDGKQCGVTSGYEDYPNVYFTDPTSADNLKLFACVKSCPAADNEAPECKGNSKVTATSDGKCEA